MSNVSPYLDLPKRSEAVPSREFMVRQAIINAIWTEYRWTLRVQLGSVAGVLRVLRADTDATPGNLVVAITREFHKLEKRFERAA